MKNETVKLPKFKWVWVTAARQHLAEAGFSAIFVLGAIGAAAAYVFAPRYVVHVLAGVAGLYVLAMGYAILVARATERANQEDFVRKWVKSGRSAGERAQRQALLDNDGFGAALGAAGAAAMFTAMNEPAFNVDGTPMIPGTSLDINHNIYGVTPMETGDWNNDTGQFISESDSYSSPMGMDQNTL